MLDVKTVLDELETRCPRLGGPVPFDYCRKVAEGLPCSRTLVCWETQFPVIEYMSRVLTEDEWKIVFNAAPESRMEKILDIAEQCRESAPDNSK